MPHSISSVVLGLISATFLLAGCSRPVPPAQPKQGQVEAPKADRGEQLTAEEQKKLDDAVMQLKSTKPEERAAAAAALGKLEMKARGATAALIEAFKDQDPAVRLEVVKALPPVGYRSERDAHVVLPALSQALKDPDTEVRRQAAASLGGISRSVGLLEPLREAALQDKDKHVRVDAAKSLGNRDPSTVKTVLGEALKDSDAAFRLHAAITLAETGAAAEAAVPLLIEAVQDKDVAVRDRAVFALGRIGTKEAVAALAELLGQEDLRTRIGASLALGRLGATAEAAVPALARAVLDKNRGVSGTAAEALGRIGPGAKGAVPALSAALKYKEGDDAWVVRKIAAKSLGKIGADAKGAVPALVQAVKLVNFQERSFAGEDIELLGAIEAKLLGADFAKSTRQRLKGGDANAVWGAYAVEFDLLEESRAAAAEALKIIDREAAKALVPELIEALKDKDAVFRYCSASALGYLGPDAGSAAPALIEVRNDKELRVRGVANRALKAIAASDP